MFKEKREGGKLVWLVGCGCGFAKELLSQRSLRKIREGREEKTRKRPRGAMEETQLRDRQVIQSQETEHGWASLADGRLSL
jgi:hypothetical protein